MSEIYFTQSSIGQLTNFEQGIAGTYVLEITSNPKMFPSTKFNGHILKGSSLGESILMVIIKM